AARDERPVAAAGGRPDHLRGGRARVRLGALSKGGRSMIQRRRIWAAAALVFAIPVSLVLLAGGKAVGPEAIRFGRDACDRCHMLLASGGFAGERRGKNGALHKYDDVGCLLLALGAAHEETTQTWVEDHAGTGFVPLMEATLVRGSSKPTPMGYGILAFRKPPGAAGFAAGGAGKTASREDLLRAGPRVLRSPQVPPAEEAPR